MPTEAGRITKRKRIKLPNGSQEEVDVPCITQISFIDPYNRHQETIHDIDNSAEGDRTVHVDDVYPVDAEGNQNTNVQPLQVQRIDVWQVIDAYERHQETHLEFDNVTGNDTLPPSFVSHLQTHVVRYYQDPDNPDDDGAWIDCELIDRFTVTDPYERHQETVYELQHSDQQADPADDNIADTDNGIDPSWRLDPFQNIVNWHNRQTWRFKFGWTLNSMVPHGTIFPWQDPTSTNVWINTFGAYGSGQWPDPVPSYNGFAYWVPQIYPFPDPANETGQFSWKGPVSDQNTTPDMPPKDPTNMYYLWPAIDLVWSYRGTRVVDGQTLGSAVWYWVWGMIIEDTGSLTTRGRPYVQYLDEDGNITLERLYDPALDH